MNRQGTLTINLLIILGVALLLSIFLMFYLLFFHNSPITISDSQISSGVSLDLKQNQQANFNLDNEKHSVTVDSVNGDTVHLIIQSNKLEADVKLGEEQKFDLNGDGYYDLSVKVVSINNGIAKLDIKKINEQLINSVNGEDSGSGESSTDSSINLPYNCGEELDFEIDMTNPDGFSEQLKCFNQKISECQTGKYTLISDDNNAVWKIEQKTESYCKISIEDKTEKRTCDVPLNFIQDMLEDKPKTVYFPVTLVVLVGEATNQETGEHIILNCNIENKGSANESTNNTNSINIDVEWGVFQNWLNAVKNKNLNTINALSYFPLTQSQLDAGMADGAYNLGSLFDKNDFVNVEKDSKQEVLSTNEQDGTINLIYLVKDTSNNLIVLGLQNRGSGTYTPNKKDTDGDGWWDDIESQARTNLNSASDYPFKTQTSNQDYLCSDSDGGSNYNAKGIITYTNPNDTQKTVEDKCDNGYLVEYYCRSQDDAKLWNVAYGQTFTHCEDYGKVCSNGACI